MYICIYVCMYICIYVDMYVCIYVYMYICIYVYMYVCMYVCMYVYIYIYITPILLSIFMCAHDVSIGRSVSLSIYPSTCRSSIALSIDPI